MLFNSIQFLFFFPVATLLYFLFPHKFRWILLLTASCVFYMAFVPVYIFILFFTIIIDYIAGIFIENAIGKKRKLFLIISLLSNIGILFFFKYYNFFIDNFNAFFRIAHVHGQWPLLAILLPIGLSFHTFQAMSYTIEVYRGNQQAERHFGIYALYVMFYPQLVAGPIERPQNLIHQFKEKHDFDWDNLLSGLRLMLWGFFKKLVIADRLALYVNDVYARPQNCSSLSVCTAMFFFAFQLFCDFSGYSDIAIGAAKTMGFDLMINFNHPFKSRNITEFWRRWHISLSTWFNDYIFTPITINKRNWGKYGIVFALICTFFISGVWHGAGWTFVIFGLLHGAACVYEFLTQRIRRKVANNLPSYIYNILSQLLTFVFLCFSWVFFRVSNVKSAVNVLKVATHIVTSGSYVSPNMNNYTVGLSLVFILGILLFDSYTTPRLKELGNNIVADMALSTVAFTLIMIFGVFNHSAFIYFQF